MVSRTDTYWFGSMAS